MNLEDKISYYPDFPKKGMTFKDFAPMFADPAVMGSIADEFAGHYGPGDVDLFAGIDAKGFILACMLAAKCGKGMVMIRKAGKLPGRIVKSAYSTEYSTDIMEMQQDSVAAGQRVVICDDMLATGGTAISSARLVEEIGGVVAGFAFIMELTEYHGAAKIAGYDRKSLVTR